MGARRTNRQDLGARDPRAVLEHLIVVCWSSGRGVEREVHDERAPAALRRCAIELSLLAEACGPLSRDALPGGGGRADEGRSRSRAGEARAEVLQEYRVALRSSLPRAIQGVLREHLTRLERCFGGSSRELVAA